MRWLSTTLTALTLATALSSTAAARDFFVNNLIGDDGRDGLAPEVIDLARGPFRTIERALRAVDKGDRIVLADTDAPYRESITLQGGRHSGFQHRPFALVGNGAVLDGSRPVPPELWEHVEGDVFRFLPQRMSFQLLFLDDLPAERQPVADGKFPELQPLQWSHFDRYVYFRVEPGRLPDYYNLSHTYLPVGLTLYQVRHVEISDLTVQGFQLDGVNAHDGVFQARLAGLICRGNARSGISVGGASRVTIEACLVGSNGAAQVRTEGWSHTRILNSDLLDDTAPPLVREAGRVEIVDRPIINNED